MHPKSPDPENIKQRNIIEDFSRFDFFSFFFSEEISLLLSCAEKAVYKKNEIIFQEGDIGLHFYTILKGEVEIRTRITGKRLALQKPGQVFGEMAVLDNQPRSATAIATTNVELFSFNGQRMLNDFPHLSIKLLRYLSQTVSKHLRVANILLDRGVKDSDVYLDVLGVIKKFRTSGNLIKFLMKRESDYFTVLDRVNLYVHRDSIVGLIGESGCGKTTLARAILGLIYIDGGKIFVDGKDISRLSYKEMRKLRGKIQMIFQNPFTSLSPRMTVKEIVEESIRLRNEDGKDIDPMLVKHYLNLVNFDIQKLDDYPHQLSGGERRRVGVARILAVKPEFIIADEPVASLDASIKAQIINMLLKLKDQENLTYLVISHDIGMISYCSDAIAVMYLGNIVEKFKNSGDNIKEALHPYTNELLTASKASSGIKKPQIKPDVEDYDFAFHDRSIQGCRYHPRCALFGKLSNLQKRRCQLENPQLQPVSPIHLVACHYCQ